MDVFTMPQKISWTSILGDMKIGDILRVSANVGRSTVAPRISREIKLMYPTRVYKTDSKSEPGILLIERKEDLEETENI